MSTPPIGPRRGQEGEMTVSPVSRDTLPVALIDPDPDQPRRHFDPVALQELADSMRENGLLERILIRPRGHRYAIVCGERRWRAAGLLGWEQIPAEVRDVDPGEAPWLQLVENLARSSLSPVEEAHAFRALLAREGMTQQHLADRLGKTRTYIAQKLRLLELPAPISLLLDRGALTEGHVRQLLRIRTIYNGRTTAYSAGTPDVWERLWADTASVEARANLAFIILRSLRPEDWPPGYPFDVAGDSVTMDAIEALTVDVAATGTEYPVWSLAAFWFAALTVNYKVPVTRLDKIIDGWIERLCAAAVYTRLFYAGDEPPADPVQALVWWGHRADLRHAGFVTDRDTAYLLDDRIAPEALIREALEDGSLPLPSELQPWGGHHEKYLALVAEQPTSG